MLDAPHLEAKRAIEAGEDVDKAVLEPSGTLSFFGKQAHPFAGERVNARGGRAAQNAAAVNP